MRSILFETRQKKTKRCMPCEAAAAPKKRVQVGAPFYTSNVMVMQKARAFDSDLSNFKAEVDANPMFGKRQYEKIKNDALREKHAKFLVALSTLNYDWSDDKEGFYPEIKRRFDSLFNPIGAAEYDEIDIFRGRYENLRKQYEAIGYKLEIAPSPKPTDDSLLAKIPWTGVLVVGGVFGVGYLLHEAKR